MFISKIFSEPVRIPLCDTCVYAHIEKGFNGEELAFCNFAVSMRPVNFLVCECTDYRDRYASAPVKVTGFVKPNVDEELEAG